MDGRFLPAEPYVLKTELDGTPYFLVNVCCKWGISPKLHEIIESHYKTVKVFWRYGTDSNDDQERFFFESEEQNMSAEQFDRIMRERTDTHNSIIDILSAACCGRSTIIDGMRYVLFPNARKAYVCVDELWKGHVVVPSSVTHNGTEYEVLFVGDRFEDELHGTYSKKSEELEGVTIPSSVRLILESAFQDAIGLKSVRFEGDIDAIADGAFAGCKSLEKVEFGGKVSCIGFDAFYRTAIEDIVIPDGTDVDDSAFRETAYGRKRESIN
ncbi:MAG: leucine-rich repeat domain-containing protein [Bacteroidales bacterium]|nr:leucine-rich repeat domain-containing protein [Bacteroidales bacterium]